MKKLLNAFILVLLSSCICAMETKVSSGLEDYQKTSKIEGHLDVVKISDDLYVGKINDEFYVAMERADGRTIDWWIKYLKSRTYLSTILKGAKFRGKTYFGDSSGMNYFGRMMYWFKRLFSPEKEELPFSNRYALQQGTELWIVYASNKPINSLVADNPDVRGLLEDDCFIDFEREPQTIEMFFSVITSPKAKITSHMGINRSPDGAYFIKKKAAIIKALEKEKTELLIKIKENQVKTKEENIEEEKLVEKAFDLRQKLEEKEALIASLNKSIERKLGQSMNLHSFAAKVMKIVYQNKEYMLTVPVDSMSKIFLNKIPAGAIFVGDNRYKNRLIMEKKEICNLSCSCDPKEKDCLCPVCFINKKCEIIESHFPVVKFSSIDKLPFNCMRISIFDPKEMAKGNEFYLIDNLQSDENEKIYSWLFLPEFRPGEFLSEFGAPSAPFDLNYCLIDLEALAKVGKFEPLHK